MTLDLRLDSTGDFYARKFQPDLRDDRLILNMGPQHPSTHGVLRVLLEVDGEYIVRAEPVLGYVHRMQEKMAEIRTYPQYLPNMGRVDYLHALAWNWAYVGAVERLMDIEVPQRAEYIRVITCELNRIKSHLLWWGAYLLDLGAFTPIMYAFADRERLMDILQRITGSRLTFCYYRFGGVSTDVDQRFVEEVRAFCSDFDERLKIFKDLVTDNIILRSRVEEVGEISPEVCRSFGATGPVMRGSGIEYDVRRAEPYSIYSQFDFQIPVYDQCDALARYMVRMDEMSQSVSIVLQALDALPTGDHIHPLAPRRPCPPPGDVYFSVESARGQVGVHLVSHGGESPYRLKLRSPSFSNLSLLSEVAEGSLISDAVSTLGSLDLVIPEIDR
ncbi:NADH dehydrogenase subunit D [Desulfonatronum thiosulfatophilum]|uniref:NADH-quinone oxidoreductase subunit D n=1 Tax=Desulfonatronum thiosulfatophilum TaxID=617002 RepID=A0A1G6CYP7_9BACT|nr:NADH-quinone oxidoreductase subunit D [Desulfonatronum thiosulfatophilum]SDB37941.1 NADH dehydrogenase subunit D [Desulfonatronum thiosulfatophilum]